MKIVELFEESQLEEGKYNEIFLKGLVGAILAGGLSLGLNYAKEKTADLDRAGLNALFKSIDPREYPELTKKLTPQDKAGLDAIIKKIKDHKMKMYEIDRDLSESYGKKINEENKENKKIKKLLLPPKDRPKKTMSNFDPRNDLKKKVAETRMPANVIKHKQAIASMTPEEKKKKFAGKSIETLKQMARRHGYGPDSNEYAKYHDGVTKEDVTETKIKGKDGKSCWKGYRYAGTKNGKDKCVKSGK